MNSRLMRLKVSGEDSKVKFNLRDRAMAGETIKGLVPNVSNVIPVTPDMLRAMLGSGYLN